MSDMCSCCDLDTAGNHAWNCPCNPNYLDPTQIKGALPAEAEKILDLQAKLTEAEKERDFQIRLVEANKVIYHHCIDTYKADNTALREKLARYEGALEKIKPIAGKLFKQYKSGQHCLLNEIASIIDKVLTDTAPCEMCGGSGEVYACKGRMSKQVAGKNSCPCPDCNPEKKAQQHKEGSDE